MINLIHAEFYKLRKSSTFKFSFLFTTICAVILIILSNGVATGKFEVASNTASGLTDIFIISVVGSLLAGSIICSDFDNKNIHDEISCGRFAIVISKVIVYVIVVCAIVLPYAVVGIVGFLSQGSYSPEFNFSTYTILMSNPTGLDMSSANIGKSILLVIVSIVVYAARLSVCIPIAFKVKKAVFVTVIGVVFSFVVDFVVNLLLKIPGLDNLIKKLPYTKTTLSMDMSNADLIQLLISSLVFITIMGSITYLNFKKAEIK